MSQLIIYGIGGIKRSGKDELAKAIAAVHIERGDSVEFVAFADALRRTVAAAYCVPVEEFTDDALKDAVHPLWGITRRDMLIGWGVPAHLPPPLREHHWVRRWELAVEELWRNFTAPSLRRTLVIIAPDIRRTNEAAAVHKLGGVNVLVQRPGYDWNGHVTEQLAAEAFKQRPTYGILGCTGLGMLQHRLVFDQVVINDGTKAQLQLAARDVEKRVEDVPMCGEPEGDMHASHYRVK